MKIIAFDLDDVLCYRDPNFENLGPDKYKHCFPISQNIKIMNDCYNTGFYVKIYTARGMSQFSGNVDEIKKQLYQMTYEQLISWEAKFHELIFGKIHYDLLIDDKAKNISEIKSLEDIKRIVDEV